MAEEKKKPLSLNQRLSRLIQDHSASHAPTPSSNLTIAQNKPTMVKLQGRRRLCKAFSQDTDADDDNHITQFSGITDIDSPPEIKMSEKVKLDGRRRLCKSSEGNDDVTNDCNNNTQMKISEIADFDSPVVVKNASNTDNGGGNEIRDILNELSSKLELLTIEKRRVPKVVDVAVNSSSRLFKVEVTDREKNADFPDYTSAASSLSTTPDNSDSSSNVSNLSSVGGGVKTSTEELCQKENDSPAKNEGDSFDGRVNRIKIVGEGHIKNEATRVDRKNKTVGYSRVSNIESEEEDDDDCVVLRRKPLMKEAGRQVSKFEEEFKDSNGFNVLDDNCLNSPVSEGMSSLTLSGPKSTFILPEKIAKMLYLHQREGLKWLWSLHCKGKGGILGDDMGLGKTMQICGFLAGLFHSNLIRRALIVAPKTLLPHWIKELSVVGLSKMTKEYFGHCAKTRQYELQYILQDKGVLLTTYDIVRNNSKSLQGGFCFRDDRSVDGMTWDYMILDEGHLIKNPSTQRAKSLLEIPSAHRIVISGTPIQNNLKELWALFYFCCPELLGDKYWFKEKYESVILRGNDKHASDREKHIGSTAAKELREHIQPYFLRRLKSEVFHEDGASETQQISKKNEMIVWLKLTGCQRQLYEAFLRSELVLSACDGSPLAALTILKKICDHPLLLTKRAAEDVLEGMDSMLNQDDIGMAERLAMHIADVTERENFLEKQDNISCKISFILSLLDNLIPEGHKVLIFSQTRKMLNLIQESIDSNGYRFLRIDGTTKANDRVKIVNDFQEGIGAPIFLLTSQVGGLGLTLTKADRVIVVDPAWNPSTDNQSVDRAYRIGQKKDVFVYRLMTCGTVEEKIYRKQIFKGGLFKTATEHKEQIRYFSQQDLRELFSLPRQGFDVSLTQQQLHDEHDHQHKMDEFLKAHIKFLENQGIAGVSHHSLLFSTAAPAPVALDEEEDIRRKETAFVGKSYSSTSVERNVDGAEYAFNPKVVKPQRKSSVMDSPGKLTESEIRERINGLCRLFADKVTVSRLPDKGEKIQRQIAHLNSELEKIRMERSSRKETIDLDGISGELQRVLNV